MLIPLQILWQLEPLSLMTLNFDAMRKKPFENTVGKGENAGNQHFLLFPTMFFTL